MKKFFIVTFAIVVLAGGVFCAGGMIAFFRGSSVDAIAERVSYNLSISRDGLRYIGGRRQHESIVFFELTEKIPESVDLHARSGWLKEFDARQINRYAKALGIPCSVKENDIIFDYRGDCFDLWIVNTPTDRWVLYRGL